MSTGNLVAQHRDEPGDGAGETSDDVHCQDGKKGWLVGWERNPADDDWPWLIPEDYSHLAKRTYIGPPGYISFTYPKIFDASTLRRYSQGIVGTP
jgi:hypothetical protein